MKNNNAVALGSIKSDKKAMSSRENGKKGGRPRKPMEIPLTQGKVALVDKEDYEELMKYKWNVITWKNKSYAVCHIRKNGSRSMMRMHRLIMKEPLKMEVDHIDGDGLNNTRLNLRVCTHKENLRNRGKIKGNTSGFKGVSLDISTGTFKSQITVQGKNIHLGRFNTKEDAYRAYCEACKMYHGEFSNLG